MNASRALALMVLLLVVGALPSAAQDSDEAARLEIARSYIESTIGSMELEKVAAVGVEQILDAVKARQPALYAEKAEKLRAVGQPIMMDAILESLNGLDRTLAATFTLEELRALNEFMTSDIGREIMRKMPNYLAAIQPAMQRGIQASLPRLLQSFRAEGVILQ